MTAIHLVMPMAGRGSRFTQAGFALPKPMLRLNGQPFFWWAAESLRRCFDVRSMTFVVLIEHIEQHRIDVAILSRYPRARLVVLPDTTAGALVTAAAGCQDLPQDGWMVVNDCDHAFGAEGAARSMAGLPRDASGMLCHFTSSNPAYSYAAYDASGRLVRTVEKKAVSELAIAGAYFFRNRGTFLDHAATYQEDCPYEEPFVSGVYNVIAAAGGAVYGTLLDRHIPFGTPDEYARAQGPIQDLSGWAAPVQA